MAAHDAAIGAELERDQDLAAPALDPAGACREALVGDPGVVAAQVEGLAAGPPGQPCEAELRGERRRDLAGREEAVLQAGVVDGMSGPLSLASGRKR